ncbi:hypothetical protein L3X38_041007 [Prunus dulcis]|uniref:F-box domain-containing protein n=1 Tax=Prunus dulcis TaxID=3755 RepID=A0AAD4US76_PRUDU|nr:hypothetical protein L3X38_041007 [Prunus dulcis]
MGWQTVPDDIMEIILKHLNLRERIRLRIICKSWNSLAMRRDFSNAPQLPWLLLPQGSNKYLSFSSVSDVKFHTLMLPKPVRGGRVCGCSKGWLVMIKEKVSKLYLVNPISRDQHQLPSLRTIPSFHKFVNTNKSKRGGALLFCNSFALSTADVKSNNCIVAAVFDELTLGLCRPGDKTWSVFHVLDENEYLAKLLFSSSGMLYALVFSGSLSKNGIVVASHSLNFGDDTVKIKLVYDKTESTRDLNPSIEYCDDFQILLKGMYASHLLQSATNNEVFVIHQILDCFLRRDGDVEEEDENEEEGTDDEDEDEDKDKDEEEIDDEEEADDEDEDEDEDEEEIDDEDETDDEDEEETDDEDDEDEEEIDDEDETDDEDDEEEETDDEEEEEDNNNDDQDEGVNNGEFRRVDIASEDAFGSKPYLRTSEFRVYKLDQENDNFDRVQCLGDDQLFFCSDAECVSLHPASNIQGFDGNCIYFATNNIWRLHSLETYASREIGVFYLDSRRIQRPFPSVKLSVLTKLTWLTPSL